MIAETLLTDTIPHKKVDNKAKEAIKGLNLVQRTQDMIGTLYNNQVNRVFNFTASLIEEDDNPFKPVSIEQVLKDLDASEEDIRAGRVKDAHQAMNDIRARLGMPV